MCGGRGGSRGDGVPPGVEAGVEAGWKQGGSGVEAGWKQPFEGGSASNVTHVFYMFLRITAAELFSFIILKTRMGEG